MLWYLDQQVNPCFWYLDQQVNPCYWYLDKQVNPCPSFSCNKNMICAICEHFRPKNLHHIAYMNIHTKCEPIVKEEKNHVTVPLRRAVVISLKKQEQTCLPWSASVWSSKDI